MRTELRQGPDFIGIGAQRSGTSWIYACLFAHPDLFLPRKEIHFFSRQRNWQHGYEWYEELFSERHSAKAVGEWSTSYLTDVNTPTRIRARYPGVKLLASLRNPIDRAYSNYLNDITSGVVPRSLSFRAALEAHPEYIEQGLYARHLERYLRHFSSDQLLILIYEDGIRAPEEFIRTIYRFIGVDVSVTPTMMSRRVGQAYTPRMVSLDRLLVRGAELFQRRRLRWVWWVAKKARMGDAVRVLNTRRSLSFNEHLTPAERRALGAQFRTDSESLEDLLGRRLDEWRE
jgi:hypothetical protein